MSGVLARLLLFLAPFILFAIWLWVMRRTALGDGRIPPHLARRITATGLALIVVTLVAFILYGLFGEGSRPEGSYVPAKAGDGGIESGHFEKKTDDDDAPPP